MASQRQIFFFALLLTVALVSRGGEAAKVCNTSSDCICRIGFPMCVNGLCSCDGTTTKAAEPACSSRDDCVSLCRKSCTDISCVSGLCLCSGCN